MVMLYKLTKKHTLWLLLILVIYINATVDYKTYIVVAKDGSGDFTAIQEAVTSCKSFPDKRITIFVKNGIYNYCNNSNHCCCNCYTPGYRKSNE